MQNTRGGDFVHVRLTDAGKELVSQGPLTCVDGRVVVTIEKGNVAWSERVMKAVDWELVLKQIRTDEQKSIFELDEEAEDRPTGIFIDVPPVVCEVCGAEASGMADNLVDTIVHKKDCPNFGTANTTALHPDDNDESGPEQK
jgi:hypothetical protein